MLDKSANRQRLPNRRKADISEWQLLADSPSKIGPPEWLPVEHACQRMRGRLGSSKLAVRDLHAWLRDGQLPSAVRQVSSNDEETCGLLRRGFWQKVSLSVKAGPNGTERFGVCCRDDSWEFKGSVHFFVRADVFERLCPTTAAPPVPSNEPSGAPRRQRPGPPTTHDWFAIWSEILRRCLIALPKSENKLAEAVAVWYEEKYKRSVSVTEVRAAVKGICAALKENQSRSKTSQR
jgi:hypothetical protein